jgi:hypothetical protein
VEIKWTLKCETALLAEMKETCQHLLFFYDFFRLVDRIFAIVTNLSLGTHRPAGKALQFRLDSAVLSARAMHTVLNALTKHPARPLIIKSGFLCSPPLLRSARVPRANANAAQTDGVLAMADLSIACQSSITSDVFLEIFPH